MPERTQAGQTQAATQGASAARAPAATANPRQATAQADYLKSLQKQPGPEGAGGPGDAAATAAAPPPAAVPEAKTNGLENYQAVLGKYLGEKLYKAVAGAVTPAKMTGYANQALDAAVGYLTGQLGQLSPNSDPKALEAFGSALETTLKPVVDEYMDSGPGREMSESLAQYVDAHPREIATVALLAAIGMVVANAKIPDLKTKFKIADGVSASIEAKLGTFRNISLEQIKGRIEAQVPLLGGTLKAEAEIENKKGANGGRETQGTVGANWQNADGTWQAGGRYGYNSQTGHSAEAYVRREDKKKNWFVEGKAGHDQQRGSYGMVGVGIRF
jgi:hypothetical protein